MPENDIKKKAEQLSAEVAAAKEQAAQAESKAASLEAEVKSQKTIIDGQKTSIDNLDKTVKEQNAAIAELKKQLLERPADFVRDFRTAFYAQKDAIMKLVKEKSDKFSVQIELKAINNIGTSSISAVSLGLQTDPTVHANVPVGNAFILAFGLRPRTGNKLSWIESTVQNGADYVGELANNTNKSDVSFVEKTRAFGKIATYMTISTEVEDWFDQLFNWCVNEGARLIDEKIDGEIFNGAGSDASQPNKLYGLKSIATAFSALASHTVKNANIADVILDAVDQIAKNGYRANVAFVTWAGLRQLKSVKDENGNYLYDKVTGMLNGVRVLPTSKLAAGEILVSDTNCAEIYAGNSFELEMIRDGALDAYNVFFRKAAQVKVPTPKAKGHIYVSSTTTAIAALQVTA